MMTQPWPQILARYETVKGRSKSIDAIGRLALRISESPLKRGLFPSPNMFALNILQTPVDPASGKVGPFLRISPASNDRVEFRYIDTYVKANQWNRFEEADQSWDRLIKFLNQLGWFPPAVLESLNGP